MSTRTLPTSLNSNLPSNSTSTLNFLPTVIANENLVEFYLTFNKLIKLRQYHQLLLKNIRKNNSNLINYKKKKFFFIKNIIKKKRNFIQKKKYYYLLLKIKKINKKYKKNNQKLILKNLVQIYEKSLVKYPLPSFHFKNRIDFLPPSTYSSSTQKKKNQTDNSLITSPPVTSTGVVILQQASSNSLYNKQEEIDDDSEEEVVEQQSLDYSHLFNEEDIYTRDEEGKMSLYGIDLKKSADEIGDANEYTRRKKEEMKHEIDEDLEENEVKKHQRNLKYERLIYGKDSENFVDDDDFRFLNSKKHKLKQDNLIKNESLIENFRQFYQIYHEQLTNFKLKKKKITKKNENLNENEKLLDEINEMNQEKEAEDLIEFEESLVNYLDYLNEEEIIQLNLDDEEFYKLYFNQDIDFEHLSGDIDLEFVQVKTEDEEEEEDDEEEDYTGNLSDIEKEEEEEVEEERKREELRRTTYSEYNDDSDEGSESSDDEEIEKEDKFTSTTTVSKTQEEIIEEEENILKLNSKKDIDQINSKNYKQFLPYKLLKKLSLLKSTADTSKGLKKSNDERVTKYHWKLKEFDQFGMPLTPAAASVKFGQGEMEKVDDVIEELTKYRKEIKRRSDEFLAKCNEYYAQEKSLRAKNLKILQNYVQNSLIKDKRMKNNLFLILNNNLNIKKSKISYELMKLRERKYQLYLQRERNLIRYEDFLNQQMNFLYNEGKRQEMERSLMQREEYLQRKVDSFWGLNLLKSNLMQEKKKLISKYKQILIKKNKNLVNMTVILDFNPNDILLEEEIDEDDEERHEKQLYYLLHSGILDQSEEELTYLKNKLLNLQDKIIEKEEELTLLEEKEKENERKTRIFKENNHKANKKNFNNPKKIKDELNILENEQKRISKEEEKLQKREKKLQQNYDDAIKAEEAIKKEEEIIQKEEEEYERNQDELIKMEEELILNREEEVLEEEEIVNQNIQKIILQQKELERNQLDSSNTSSAASTSVNPSNPISSSTLPVITASSILTEREMINNKKIELIQKKEEFLKLQDEIKRKKQEIMEEKKVFYDKLFHDKNFKPSMRTIDVVKRLKAQEVREELNAKPRASLYPYG